MTLTHSVRSVTRELGVEGLDQIIYGVSLGGLVAFYQMALDPEIDGLIVSQWSEDRFEKLVDPDSRDAMWRYENGDYSILLGSALELRDRFVAQLIYPRPFGIEVGEEDPRASSMLPLIEALSRLYDDRPGNLHVRVNEGGHEMLYSPVVSGVWSQVQQ